MSKDDARRTGETIRQLFFDARESMQHRGTIGGIGGVIIIIYRGRYNVTYGPYAPYALLVRARE
jgi:hypothetical protein